MFFIKCGQNKYKMYKGINFKLGKEIVDYNPRLIWAWNVFSDNGYKYTRSEEDKSFYPTQTFVMIRLFRGQLVIECENEKITLREGELAVLSLKNIVKYYSLTEMINYHWYNFVAEYLPYFSINRVYNLDIQNEENLLFTDMNEYSDNPIEYGEYMANLKFAELTTLYIIRLSEREIGKNDGISLLIKTIREEYGKDISLAFVAKKHNMSERSLRNHFHKYVGMSPKQYQLKIRMQKATEQLSSTLMGVNEIAEQLGYLVCVHFSRDFKNYYGISPTEYRRKNNN